MTLTIILFVLVSVGIVMFAYALNKQRNTHREEGLKDGKKVREGNTGDL